jgi:hypothetical protein
MKPACDCKLMVKHLKPRTGARARRTVGLKHVIYDWLHQPRGTKLPGGATLNTTTMVRTDGLQRGALFMRIETAEQAKELVALGHAKAAVIPDRAAYDRILEMLFEKGWEAAIKRKQPPPGFGLTATHVPGLGWRVRGLLLTTDGFHREPEGVIRYVDYNVGHDGRLARKSVTYVETGLDAILGMPEAGRWNRLPRFVVPTEEEVEVPQLAQERDEYLKPAGWPEEAMKK